MENHKSIIREFEIESIIDESKSFNTRYIDKLINEIQSLNQIKMGGILYLYLDKELYIIFDLYGNVQVRAKYLSKLDSILNLNLNLTGSKFIIGYILRKLNYNFKEVKIMNHDYVWAFELTQHGSN